MVKRGEEIVGELKKTFSGLRLSKEPGDSLSISAFVGKLRIVKIEEYHRTRLLLGIEKGDKYKYRTSVSGSGSYKSLGGLVIALDDDDLMQVLEATVSDVAQLMGLPTSISLATLMHTVRRAVQSGASTIIPQGNQLVEGPPNAFDDAIKWASKIPASRYQNCSLAL